MRKQGRSSKQSNGWHPCCGFDSLIEREGPPAARGFLEQLQNMPMGLLLVFLAHVIDRAAGDAQNLCEFSILSPFVGEQQDTGTGDGAGTLFPLRDKLLQGSSFGSG